MSKKKILFLGSVPMSLSELQMAPAIVGASVRRRGHDFRYQDINLKLFDYCGKDYNKYLDQTEFLQDKDSLDQTNDIIDRWQKSILKEIRDVDLLLVNVFSVFSHVPALRILRSCRDLYPDIKIIIGGIGSQKKILGGINRYNADWVRSLFPRADDEIFGRLCLQNHLIDDWQPDVGLDILEKWLPLNPIVKYDKEVDFDPYDIDRYQWVNNEKRIPMLGSHGCVRQCTFCDVIKHFPRYSFVEADVLTKSIVRAYQDTGVNRVQFMDSLVNGSMTNFLQLLKNLAQAREQGWLPENFSWSGTYICRPRGKILDEIHQYLKPSGVDNLVIGVETGSDRVRFQMEKKFTNDDLLYELEAFRRHGVKASALFFPSWPTETPEDFEDTLDLFSRLSRYAQDGTLENVSLGTSGFSLIDGTPIDRDKDQIGLSPGPISWLWTCASNPGLTFWESLRRRLLMAEWCEMLGIRLDSENTFRQMLAVNLKQYHEVIKDYSGPLPEMIDPTKYLPASIDHNLKMTVINQGLFDVVLGIKIGDQAISHVCGPGLTPVDFRFTRDMTTAEKLEIGFVFDQRHQVTWATYDSGDYYDANGVYLDDIWADHCDITYWGWNHAVDLEWVRETSLPEDYLQHQNLRCITPGMQLSINLPRYHSMHRHIISRRDPVAADTRSKLDDKLYSRLRRFLP